MTKLLALIDASVYAQSVCDHAAWAAARLDASVEVLHVLGRRDTSSIPADYTGSLSADARDTLLAELAALDEEKARLAQKRGRLVLDEAKARLAAAGIDAVTSLRLGDLTETVAEREVDAELVVIGKRGEAADFAKLHLGSNLERVVRASRRPVLVAARAFRPIERVLVAFDGGASALKAVDHIARSPMFAGLSCRLLMVGAETSDARKKLDGAVAQLAAAGYVPKADLVPGQPEQVIAQSVEREGIDLLVMGAYGHSRIRNLIVGSTTVEMVRSCKIPIMMFR
ncbi:universal stress protein [Chelatococcus daeguensis]|uniref:Universal stress protein UspA n=1 Tax=Chelatococcus daeguensis TaxID=444444 RepID=A0AAC9JN20_9HYPH|nr:universal stress protein [Chelatococcus daeguensis]APF36479.1 universal stress protein UspA [Chelatococcus daeguensis]KZE33705.1 universal stress protein UspA [Chelatococcus daeguensis]MBM3082777.1 universal stress protein [Chelatococcus daeguensis]